MGVHVQICFNRYRLGKMNLENAAQKIEQYPPLEIFTSIVETVAALYGNVNDTVALNELCLEEELAQLPWRALTLLSLSKRLHSIFVLRLFNDCFAMTLLHASLVPLLYEKWHLSLVIFRWHSISDCIIVIFRQPKRLF